jgi:chemotaxis-related protein WspB
MLMLLCYVGDERYALESSRIVEIVPKVALKKLHHAPEYIPGLFNYRGRIIPVIDLCHLIQGHPCRPHLSTRIILVKYQQHHFSGLQSRDLANTLLDDYTTIEENLFSTNSPQILGLMAERVTETFKKPKTEFVDPGIRVDTAPYLGEIMTDEKGMIQFVRVEYLLPEAQQTYLLPQQEDT